MITSISFGYTKIYDLTTETPISSGVNLKNIRRFITGGWLNINILEVDLTDPYVKVDMLTPENGMYNIDLIDFKGNGTSYQVATPCDIANNAFCINNIFIWRKINLNIFIININPFFTIY